jgi:uncharacterized phage-like protein YoqJ
VSEELEKVVVDLKKKYPELKIALTNVLLSAHYMEHNAMWCKLGRMLDNAINLGTDISNVAEEVSPEETKALVEAKDKFLKEVCDMLVEKCECKIAREI